MTVDSGALNITSISFIVGYGILLLIVTGVAAFTRCTPISWNRSSIDQRDARSSTSPVKSPASTAPMRRKIRVPEEQAIPSFRKVDTGVWAMNGKDATVLWDVVRRYGIGGSHTFAFHRTPGFGDCNWTDVISELRRGGFTGSIDIEGWHDPVYRGRLEMTGQVHALNHLKRCRGGSFVPNPDHIHLTGVPADRRRAVSLHLYGRTMSSFNVYDLETRSRRRIEVAHNES